jgi:glycosyltransferase involved in cell wall biosynthesis
MRYPNILFFRYDKYNHIDKFFQDNKEKLLTNVNIINNNKELNKLFDSTYHILITYGPITNEYYGDCNSILVDRMYKRWLHLETIDDVNKFNNSVNYCYINNVIQDRTITRPIFSIFTTTFNSYSRILRAYESIKKQILKDWEWVIVDDSPDENHFTFLKHLFQNDKRIRLYRRNGNSGCIGEVKNEAVQLCRGSYLLEMDHDDEILPNVLSNAYAVFKDDPEVGFVYMDTVNIHENGDNYNWGDYVSKGYGSYYTMKHNNKWVYVYITPNINNITLSHIVCVPNHPRIWKREVILKVGNYSEFLPICDDLELLLRTAINTKMARIGQFGYLQYMNDGGNNFTWIRNAEIQRIGPMVVEHFNKKYKIDEVMKTQNAYEDEKYKWDMSKIWKREDTYEHKYCNKIYNFDYDKQVCIIGLDWLIENLEQIKPQYANKRTDFIVLDNKVPIEQIWDKLDELGLTRMKCYTFKDETPEEMIKYFNLLYKTTKESEILNPPFPLLKKVE